MDPFSLAPKFHPEMETELAEFDNLRQDNALFERVKTDLSRLYPNLEIRRGWHSKTVQSHTECFVNGSRSCGSSSASTSNPLPTTPPSLRLVPVPQTPGHCEE
jgi:hypothetical protein